MKIKLSVLAVTWLGACASTPNVHVQYYGAKADLTVTVTQTAGCSEKDKAVFTSDVKFVSSYSRDQTHSGSVELDKLDGVFADADFTIEQYSDGRLKGINANQTGKGREVFEAVLKLGSLVTGIAGSQKTACDALQAISDKPISVIRTGSATLDTATLTTGTFPIKQISLPDDVWADVQPLFGTVTFSLTKGSDIDGPTWNRGTSTAQSIKLWKAIGVTANLTIDKTGANSEDYSTELIAPGLGANYEIPLPEAAIFGGTSMELVLDESGTVTKLKYGSTTGAPAALGTLSAAFPEPDETTTAGRAAEIKAQGDLIAHQQRLIRCQTDPVNCE